MRACPLAQNEKACSESLQECNAQDKFKYIYSFKPILAETVRGPAEILRVPAAGLIPTFLEDSCVSRLTVSCSWRPVPLSCCPLPHRRPATQKSPRLLPMTTCPACGASCPSRTTMTPAAS